VLTAAEARRLLDSIDCDKAVGLRDRLSKEEAQELLAKIDVSHVVGLRDMGA
jgi:hypothetical protein